MNRKLACLSGMLCLLALFGCGKGKETGGVERSVVLGQWCFTEEGIVEYNNSRTGKVDYFDYKTKSYRPLCGAPSCTHDSEECFAVYLKKNAWPMGRLGDQWYYKKYLPDGNKVFCCSDLD